MKETVLLLMDHDHQETKMERASIGKTPEGTSPSGEQEQPPCHKFLKETCTDPSCDYGHPPN